MKRLLLCVFFVVAPLLAMAQDSARRVLIIGDQMAGGMGGGLTRMAEAEGGIEIFNRFVESTGLARIEFYDWAGAIPKITEGRSFTHAFVLIGINDRRDIRSGDASVKFGTPEWDTIYKTRIDALIDALKAQNMQVYWMGQPPMGDPGFDADMQNLTALIKERAAAKGANFIDLRTPFLGPDGGYAERGPDDTGTDRRLRLSDGITFFKVGNNRLGQIAISAMKSGSVASAPAVAVAAPAQTPELTKDELEGPIFGQQDMNGQTVAQGGKDVVQAVAVSTAVQAANAASPIGIAAFKGSNAEALLTTGIAAPAPKGRFDDYSE